MNINRQEFIAHTYDIDTDYRIFLYSDTNSQHLYTHTHDFFEMYILIAGHVQYRTAATTFYLQPNDILFINRHQPHCPVLIDSNETYERIALHISPKILEHLSISGFNLCECFVQDNFTVYHYPHEIHTKIINLINKLFSVKDSNLPEDILLGRSYLTQLFVEINKYSHHPSIYSFNADTIDLQMPIIIKQYILEHLQEVITIDELAAYFFMNKYSFMHAFKRNNGISVYQFILQTRLEASLEMIKQGVSLTTVSLSCGFNDYSNFYRNFRKQYGCSPRNAASQFSKHRKGEASRST